MLGSDVMRGYNDMLILCLLCEGDSYGYAISREIERRSGGEYPIRKPRCIPHLDGWKSKATLCPIKAAKRRADRAPITPSRMRGGAPMLPNAPNGTYFKP